jgi:hypothetical protein
MVEVKDTDTFGTIENPITFFGLFVIDMDLSSLPASKPETPESH